MNAHYSAASFGDAYTAHIDTFARERLPPREQWPEFRFDLPELHYPPRLNCASVLLDEAILEGHGARTALYSSSANWSYFELLEHANRIANVLVHDLGVVPGNRVLLRGANSPTLVASWLAVMKVGAIAVTSITPFAKRASSLRCMKRHERPAACRASPPTVTVRWKS
jgi:2-aminobenzoate-CoA ligase